LKLPECHELITKKTFQLQNMMVLNVYCMKATWGPLGYTSLYKKSFHQSVIVYWINIVKSTLWSKGLPY